MEQQPCHNKLKVLCTTFKHRYCGNVNVNGPTGLDRDDGLHLDPIKKYCVSMRAYTMLQLQPVLHVLRRSWFAKLKHATAAGLDTRQCWA